MNNNINFSNLKIKTNLKILVIGDLMLDQYWIGNVHRISPEAPVPILSSIKEKINLGGAANVALNCKSLGANVKVLGICGKDKYGSKLKFLMSKNKISYELIECKDLNTILKLRLTSQNQQLVRVDFENKFNKKSAIALYSIFLKNIDFADIIIISDYNKGSLLNIKKIIESAKLKQKKVIVDPKGNDFDKYFGADIITPNFFEFEKIVGKCRKENDIVKKGQDLIKKLDLKNLLITRGDKGMTLLGNKGEINKLDAIKKQVFDVTGAGDTVVASLGVFWGSNFSIETSTFCANLAASVVVGNHGASNVSMKKLKSIIKDNRTFEDKFIPRSKIFQVTKKLKKQNRSLVLTNGCFDILHHGHISFLNEAKRMGDILIVAVNEDNSVKKLKGLNRPINDLHSRCKVLSALLSIDYITTFSEESPEKLIMEIIPDVLVKGGDYKINEIAGGSFVLSKGGLVKALNYIDGVSTTKIIKELNSL